jgi:hypothetical protein
MRKNAYYIDTEAIGFHGVPVLIQWAYEDGPIHLHRVWDIPVRDTLALIQRFTEGVCVFFNASFDWFQLCKIATMWRLLPPDAIPSQLDMNYMAAIERDARSGPCLKPLDVIDLMVHSQKGEHQTLMSRHDVRVTKVPTVLAGLLAAELEVRLDLDGILFAARKNKNAPKWGVYDRINRKGEVDPDFKDVTLKFTPARGLKYLAQYCLGLDPKHHSFKDVYPERDHKLAEIGYAPFAYAISSPEKHWKVWDRNGKLKGYAWPALIHQDFEHWRTNEEALQYAQDDVKYTRMLDEYFGFPESGDNDSVLACMVAAVRWHGFTIDTEKITELLRESQSVLAASPVNCNKPSEVRAYLREVMDESEAILIDKSTKKANLEKIRDEYVVKPDDIDPELGGELCIRCFGEGCPRCGGKGSLPVGRTLASVRADELLKVKAAVKEVELYGKLLEAGMFHANFKVIGTLSSRMSGGGGLNAQGIKNDADVRSSFPLTWPGMQLCGGDFDSFEVTLADAVFKDAKLREDLLAGLSIHTLMAKELYPDKTFEQILASKSHKDGGDVDMYTRGKQAVFATLYGGDHNTINKKLSIPMKVAEAAFDSFQRKYPGMKKARDEVAKSFQALEQHEDQHISYTPPDDFIETFLGFKRFFTLENKIAKVLFDLACNVPKAWHQIQIEVVRRERKQKMAGAVASALYGAAFGLQAANIRAANNHLIQSPGAMITKHVQRAIWDIQPHGINEWHVAPMNIHDEILSVTRPDLIDRVAQTVVTVVESYRDRVPLIGMKWVRNMDSWAGKSGDGNADIVHVSPHGVKGLRDDVYVPPMDIEELDELEDEETYQEVELIW